METGGGLPSTGEEDLRCPVGVGVARPGPRGASEIGDDWWEAAAHHNVNARLGYPRLLGNDAAHRHRERLLDEPGALLSDDASDHSTSSLPRPELDQPPAGARERDGRGGGGAGGIAVAAVAGAIASIVLNVLRRR